MSSPAGSDGAPGAAPPARPAILLEQVSVWYRRPRERVVSLKEWAIRSARRRVAYDRFWALRGVSLSIGRGEVFGVMGRNGAGKSTLLKLVARILPPTAGRVRVWGRVAPLLEFGAGFHPDLTGRENVFLNGALLGLSRAALLDGFERIVAFAELDGFIDAPLRTYSSGMIARLGFAIATEQRPDILLVDEALAVGDQQFRAKCAERIAGFRAQGAAIVLVSHDPRAIRAMCGRAAWLERGLLRQVGPADDVADAYAGPPAASPAG
jgi:ABC-2 type transport system ATP-binding protein/lipopolysaccharide transport system ATP-binding protein